MDHPRRTRRFVAQNRMRPVGLLELGYGFGAQLDLDRVDNLPADVVFWLRQ